MKIIITNPAGIELSDAAEYYEASQPGLSQELLFEVEQTLSRIKMTPRSGSPYNNYIRYQLMHRFPYSVYYTEENGQFVIIAIAHQHRKPGYWMQSIPGNKGDEIKEPMIGWPLTFEPVEDARLREMLKATPAQRLEMAEEMLKFANLAHTAKQLEKYDVGTTSRNFDIL